MEKGKEEGAVPVIARNGFWGEKISACDALNSKVASGGGKSLCPYGLLSRE